MHNFISINKPDARNICCGVGSKHNAKGVYNKCLWLDQSRPYGLVFIKSKCSNNSDKVFIEYLPSEFAWAPIKLKNSFHINCLWVSGRHKSMGFGKALLNECFEHAVADNKSAVTVICGQKKLPYLACPKFLSKMGFVTVSLWKNYQIMAKLYDKNIKIDFSESLNNSKNVVQKGLHIFYSAQCPFTTYYVEEVAVEEAQNFGIQLTLTKFSSYFEAQNAPVPWTTYGAFMNGEYIGHSILSKKMLVKLFMTY